MVKARDIDRIGTQGIINILKGRVRNTMLYISVDIDVLDPAFAPGISSFCYVFKITFFNRLPPYAGKFCWDHC